MLKKGLVSLTRKPFFIFKIGETNFLRYNSAVIIHIKSTNLDLTPSIKAFVDEKLGALGKYVKKFETEGEVEMNLELARTTKHHHKGPVFKAEANLLLPGNMLRAEHIDTDIRVAIDRLKVTLRNDIEKYKERTSPRSAKGK